MVKATDSNFPDICFIRERRFKSCRCRIFALPFLSRWLLLVEGFFLAIYMYDGGDIVGLGGERVKDGVWVTCGLKSSQQLGNRGHHFVLEKRPSLPEVWKRRLREFIAFSLRFTSYSSKFVKRLEQKPNTYHMLLLVALYIPRHTISYLSIAAPRTRMYIHN